MWRRFFLSALLSGSAFAQALTLSVASPVTSARPGATYGLNVTLAGSAGLAIAGVQWSIVLPAGFAPTVTAGAASTAANKTVTCSTATAAGGTMICLSVGLNSTPFADGVVAVMSGTVPVTATIGAVNFLTSADLAATAAGAGAAIAAGAPLAFTVLSPCDLNGDGKIDAADLALEVGFVVNPSSCQAPAGDFDGDGKCTVIDAVRLAVAAAGVAACRVGP